MIHFAVCFCKLFLSFPLVFFTLFVQLVGCVKKLEKNEGGN